MYIFTVYIFNYAGRHFTACQISVNTRHDFNWQIFIHAAHEFLRVVCSDETRLFLRPSPFPPPARGPPHTVQAYITHDAWDVWRFAPHPAKSSKRPWSTILSTSWTDLLFFFSIKKGLDRSGPQPLVSFWTPNVQDIFICLSSKSSS